MYRPLILRPKTYAALLGSVAIFTIFSALAAEDAPQRSLIQHDKQSNQSAVDNSASDIGTSVSPEAALDDQGATKLERLFQKAFAGRQRQSGQTLKLQSVVEVDGTTAGGVFVLTKQGSLNTSDTLIDSFSLKAACQTFILEHVLEAIGQKANTLGYVRLSDLEDAGLQASFNPRTLKTTITVPTELRVIQEESLRSRRPKVYGQPLKPSKVSAVLNVAAARVYQHTLGAGWQPFTLDFRGAVNIKTFVLEGDFVYRQGNARPWQRNSVRLVKDFPSLALRTSIGDLQYTTQGFQSTPMLGGISVARNFSLRPYEAVQSSGSASFVLTSPSRVEFFVNGQLVDTRNLPTGPHRISDFPLGAGANDIDVRITDAYGRVETKNFPFFFATDVLSQGVHDFSYNIGYLTTVDNQGLRHYKTDTPTLSFAHRVGVSSALTFGLNYQGNRDQQMVGGEISTATLFGSFGLTTAFSRNGKTEKHNGQSVALQYVFTPQSVSFKPSFSLQWRTQSPYFSSLRTELTDPINVIATSYAARYSQTLFNSVAASISGTYDIWRGTGRGNSQTLGFSKNLAFGPFLTLSMSRTLTPNIDQSQSPTQDKRVLMGLTWSLGGSKHLLGADFDSSSHLLRSRWSYLGGSSVGDFSASAALSHSPSSNGAEGQLSYTGNRFTASVNHTHASPNDSSSSDTTSLRAETALVFADGYTTFSRPVYDSFVMVKPVKALKGHPLKINKDSRGGYTSRADLLGAAVLPNTLSYYVQNITLDRGGLPVGTQLASESYYVESPYRNGAVIEVGTDAVVLVRGQLIDEHDQPLALATVEITSQTDASAPSIIGFTNRKGRFSMEGLKPGAYTVRVLAGDNVYTMQLTIPEETQGVYNLNQVRPTKE